MSEVKAMTEGNVGELIDLLSNIPKDYKVSVCGISNFAIVVDSINKTILMDDEDWIEEHCGEGSDAVC